MAGYLVPPSEKVVCNQMVRSRRFVELRCAQCKRRETLDRRGVLDRLRAAGKLRARSDPESDLLDELLRVASRDFLCSSCGGRGLTVDFTPDDPTGWPGPKPCAGCGKPIPEERLQAVPQATRCTACQDDEEAEDARPTGRKEVENEYCPRCGSPMQLKPSRTTGVTRYLLVCTASPPCRR